jgi:hypothetical protein
MIRIKRPSPSMTGIQAILVFENSVYVRSVYGDCTFVPVLYRNLNIPMLGGRLRLRIMFSHAYMSTMCDLQRDCYCQRSDSWSVAEGED